MEEDSREAVTPIDLPEDWRFETVFTARGAALEINMEIPATEKTQRIIIEQIKEK